MTPRARIAALLTIVGGAALTAGQQPQSPDVPTFKVQVDYVEVDVVVADRNGDLVRDLKKEDFQVLEDGKAQTISSFSMIDLPIERYQRPLYVSQPIEPDVMTNERPFNGRLYVAVIDDLHMAFGRTVRVKSAARKFIQEHLGANDRMAIVHTMGPRDASQEFTNNKRLLLAAVDRTIGGKLDSPTLTRTREFDRQQTIGVRQPGDPISDPEEAERAQNARRSLDALRDISRWFAGMHGRRKTILFFSEGIDYDITDVFRNRSASMLLDATREAIAASTRGNVSIYSIDPRGLTDLGDESITVGGFPAVVGAPEDTKLGIGQKSIENEIFFAQSSLRELADETGGFAIVNRNDFSTAFDRIVRDNSTYYLLAYYPPTDKPGKVHSIRVRVNRPGVTVRSRKEYMTPKAPSAPREASSKNAAAKTLSTPEVRDALASPIPISGLTMRVFAAPFKGTPPNASVLLGIDLRGRDLRLAANDKVLVSYVAVDAQDKTRASNTDVLTMNLKPETKARAEQNGFRLLNRVDLPPGRYELRVAAHDTGGGKLGSVCYDLEVPDFTKAPLSMSGVALASASAEAAPIAHLDDQIRSLLPIAPTARRTFPPDDELALFVEVYDNEASKPHKVDITSTVTTDEGKVMVKSDEVRDSTDLGGARGGYGYAARIPLKDFAPGNYVLTVSARSRLGQGASVERQVQFTIGER